MHKIGEIREATTEDFEKVRELCHGEDGWTLQNSKSNIQVWLKKNELSSFQMMKFKVDFDDVPVDLFFDVGMDGEYMKEWDHRIIDSYEFCHVNACSDIGYLSVKSPRPLKNRDFVSQRSWYNAGPNKEKIIFNHSVIHAKYPAKKGFVRGFCFLAGCHMIPTSSKSCTYYYFTQVDPGGQLPAWVVNMISKVIGPKLIKKLRKACLKYEKWKSKHNPTYKPWLNPNQIKVPKLDWNDIQEADLNAIKSNAIDESQINESEAKDEELDDD